MLVYPVPVLLAQHDVCLNDIIIIIVKTLRLEVGRNMHQKRRNIATSGS